ncbi:MAG: type II toxin-antitoxin system VapB family antitoxin [Spirochaetaceae bacterium]|nr:type II toxin-antitoxin system VapB family antitoxin [Spirochaetaceae bacterium]
MPFNTEGAETHALAQRLARPTGESATTPVGRAVQRRPEQVERSSDGSRIADELDHIALHCANLTRRDRRSADQIVGYDERGLPA